MLKSINVSEFPLSVFPILTSSEESDYMESRYYFCRPKTCAGGGYYPETNYVPCYWDYVNLDYSLVLSWVKLKKLDLNSRLFSKYLHGQVEAQNVLLAICSNYASC